MIKKMICLLLILAWLLTLVGCGTRTVTCDGCGAEISVKENSNVTDEWTLFCSQCEKDLFGEDGIVSAD